MTLLTLLICKLILWLLRRTGHTGSALPGLVAEKLNKKFLPKMLAKLPMDVVLVSGTNGKTTTTKLIVELLNAQGLRVLTNQTGSNFERGISAVIIDKASLGGRLDYDIAVLEQDEAYAARLVQRITPAGLVALNIMRDQMDRFGEIDHTAQLLAKVASKTTDWLVLNSNDPRISLITQSSSAKKVFWFGYDKPLAKAFISDDQLYHQDDTKYSLVHEPDVKLIKDIDNRGKLTVRIAGTDHLLSTRLTGSHNAVNIVAALAAVRAILPNAPIDKSIAALATVEPAFGRGELIQLKAGGSVLLQLVKNPSSFSYALHSMASQPNPKVVGVAINDNYADSRDVSWLWDVQFDALAGTPQIICGGTRGYDMAVRLKYDGLTATEEQLVLDKFLKSCLKAIGADGHAVIFCTYTAMLALRRLLPAHGSVDKVGV